MLLLLLNHVENHPGNRVENHVEKRLKTIMKTVVSASGHAKSFYKLSFMHRGMPKHE